MSINADTYSLFLYDARDNIISPHKGTYFLDRDEKYSIGIANHADVSVDVGVHVASDKVGTFRIDSTSVRKIQKNFVFRAPPMATLVPVQNVTYICLKFYKSLPRMTDDVYSAELRRNLKRYLEPHDEVDSVVAANDDTEIVSCVITAPLQLKI